MSDVGFYHLIRSSADQVLPALLGRTLLAGERALVLCSSSERVAALDTALWLCPEPDWLPHGSKAMGHPELQPIWITDRAVNENQAKFLFLIDGVAVEDLSPYARVFDLFDGNSEDQVQAARKRYVAARTAGHGLSYWQQTQRGWEKK